MNKHEYEMQLFGVSPKAVVGMLYTMFMDYLMDSISCIKNHLLSTYKRVPPQEIEQDLALLYEKNRMLADKNFDKLEAYVTHNLMMIRPHVLLEQDSVHRQFPCADLQRIELARLMKEINREECKQRLLKEELAVQRSVLPYLEEVLQRQKERLEVLRALPTPETSDN